MRIQKDPAYTTEKKNIYRIQKTHAYTTFLSMVPLVMYILRQVIKLITL